MPHPVSFERFLRRAPGGVQLALVCALAVCAQAYAAQTVQSTLTLPEVVSRAMSVERYGEVGRARWALQSATGAEQLAEGAFDWALRNRTGYDRIYQPGISGNLLTSDVRSFNILSSTTYVEKQFQNGIRVRPGYLLTQNQDQFQSNLARLGNRPLLQMDVPLDRNFGSPPDTLRLQAAQSDVKAAESDAVQARQSYLHRVMSTVWLHVAAREKAAVNRELAQRLETVAERVRKLANAGEAASLGADELRGRASLARALAERDSIEVSAARIQLAGLLNIPPQTLAGVTADLPRSAGGTVERDKLPGYIEDALKHRPELRSYAVRVESAKLRGLVGEREVDSQLTLTVGHDRLLVNYYRPLGDNRLNGARTQALAGIGAAEDILDEARQKVRIETELALDKLVASRVTIERANAAMMATRERFALVEQLVNDGRQLPATLADAADQFAAARRQTIDATLIYALALADFRRATGAIPEGAVEPATIAALFTTEP
jgi:outer membrane protein TolC